jgi:hypothetical protein
VRSPVSFACLGTGTVFVTPRSPVSFACLGTGTVFVTPELRRRPVWGYGTMLDCSGFAYAINKEKVGERTDTVLAVSVELKLLHYYFTFFKEK